MTKKNKIRILALSGSLRNDSYNSSLLTAIKQTQQDNIEFTIYGSMAKIPLFNPDNDDETIAIINHLRNEIKNSDGLVISSPEYAHGISGVLKNTLDWLVSGDEFPYIPIMLCNTSPRATHAQLALREVLSTMSGNIVEQASIDIALLGTDYKAGDIINNKEMEKYIKQQMSIFVNAVKNSDKNNKSC